MADLMKKLETIAREHQGEKIVGVRVKLGALSHISSDHFREHFEEAAAGTSWQGAQLEVEISEDPREPHAHDVILLSVGLED
jgi:hydrogenase nickel incorporation protein HypA/HybF